MRCLLVWFCLAAGGGVTAGAAVVPTDPPTEVAVPRRATPSVATSQVWTTTSGDSEASFKAVFQRQGDGVIVLEGQSGDVLTLPLGSRGYLGLHVVALTPELRVHLGGEADRGVLISKVAADSPAQRAGLKAGDLLLTVNGDEIISDWDLKRVIAPAGAGDPVRLAILRDGAEWTLEAKLESRRSRTLDLAPLLGTDETGRTILFTPYRQHLSTGEPTPLRVRVDLLPDDETTVHLEHAFGGALEVLEDETMNQLLGEEFESRRELEERIEFLERRLLEIEAQLEAEKPKD